MGKRCAFGLLGFALGAVIVLLLFTIRRPHYLSVATSAATAFCISCSALVTWVAERKGKVKSIAELRRPPTLFSRTTPPRSS
jgi:uncharacterized membrane protein YfcA